MNKYHSFQLYPYHISDVVVEGLRITPFAYYVEMMLNIIGLEKSYDSLPNFTAADCKFLLYFFEKAYGCSLCFVIQY